MKKCLIVILACLCWNSVNGQDRKQEKAVKNAIKANETIIDALEAEKQKLEDEYRELSERATRYGQRRFSQEITEAELEKALTQHTFQELFGKNSEEIRKRLEWAEDSPLKHTYVQIRDIYDRLARPYNLSTNKADKERLEKLTPLECHQEGMRQLKSAVGDYRFVMFELARVIKLIDGMKGTSDQIRNRLNESNETEYITESIPYAHTCLENYIQYRAEGNTASMMGLKGELYGSCPEAFSDFFTNN